ncbi:MAG: SdrD B-like domain-containing protein [Caldimonas sp.]
MALAALLLGSAAFAVDVQVSSFTDSPDPAVRGGAIAFTITVENSDADTANNVVATYALPTNTQFVSVNDPAVPGACSHNGLVPGTVTCTYATLLGTLAAPTAGPVRTITVVLRTTGASVTTLASTVTVTTTDTDSSPGNNTLSQNTTVNNGADLAATVAGAPDPVVGGTNVTWTVSGSNLGPNTSGAISFTTTLPGVLTYVVAGSGGTGWTCPASVVSVVTCTRAALAPGAYPNLAIVTKLTGAASGTVTLSGNITSTVGDPDLSNNSPVSSVGVTPGADLAVTQSAPSPATAVNGAAVTFVLQPSNAGPNAATAGASVSFPLPAGFAVTSATGSAGWVCASAGAPATVTCTFAGSLASGASGTLTIVTSAPTVATPTNYTGITATIAPNSGGPTDPNAANNTATRSVIVSPDGLDLSATKSKTPSFVALGANMVSTIVVKNTGPRTAASGSVTLVDALDPTKEQYVGFSGTSWACVSAPPNVTCTYNAALGIANANTLTITTKALAAGTATNSATTGYSGSPGDFNAANDTIAASVTVTATNNSPDLQVALSAATAGGVQTTVEATETAITYTATLSNKLVSTAQANNVVVTLSIPGRSLTTNVQVTGLVLNQDFGLSNAAFTCSGTGSGSVANVVCTQGAGTFLDIGDNFVFTVVANRPMTAVTAVNANLSAISTTQGDPLPGDNTTTLTITVDPIADVEVVSKVLAANPVLAGTSATYTITLRNNGPSPAAGVSLADVFTIPGGDSGFTYLSATPSNSGVCSGLTAGTSYTSGTPTLTCTWAASMANAAVYTVSVVVRPNWQAGAGARTLANTATISTTTAEDSVGGQGSAANSKSLTLNISPAQVDMLINNTDSPDPLGYDPVTASNNDITYTVATTNAGPSLASGTGFSFTVTPPAGKTMTFRGDGAGAGVAAANPSGTIAGSICDQLGSSITGPATLTVTCTFLSPGTMASGTTVNRYLVFRVASAPNTGGDVYNTNATVFRNETDSNVANDSEGEGTTVRVRADLSIVKTASINPAQMREPFNWSVVVSNAGPGDSQTTGLTDTLPSGMPIGGAVTWAMSSGGSGTCTVVGQAVTCAFGLLPAGQNVTVTVPARVTSFPSGGATQNCATATTSEIDPNSANNLSVCTTLTVQRSSLNGTIFEDRDRVGANGGTHQGVSTEPGIQGVVLTLTGTDAYGNTVSSTQTSASDGRFTFAFLSPAGASGYTITETQPAAYVNGPVSPPLGTMGGAYARGGSTGNSSWSAIALLGNSAGSNYHFPEVRRPSLSGFVYIDGNANNVRDAGTDTAIIGATVRLLDAGTLAVVATTTTGGTGAYSFANLDPLVVYTLEEPLPASPAGLGNSAVNPGLINGAACASGCMAQPNTPAADTDRIASIDLGTGTDGTLFNFGELQVTTVSGLVFVDANRNNALDSSDTGRVASTTVRLVQGADCTSGTTVQTTTTAVNGTYSFAGVVAAQNYLVCETQPAGYGTGSANGTPGSNVITITNLASSGSASNNFGETLAQISGSVYQDYTAATPANTNNGVRDGGEVGIVSVPVTLSGQDINGAAVNTTIATDAGGNYLFGDLLQSDAAGYTLSEGAIPVSSGVFADGKDTAGSLGASTAVKNQLGAIVVPAGTVATGYLFGELPIAPIGGTVYIDRNRNGTIEATPTDGRIVGVSITLHSGATCAGASIATTTTDASGNYALSGLPAGSTVTVCETQPAGYAEGSVNPGTAAASAAINAITITNLPAGGSAANNFGEQVGSLAGSVYIDYSAATPSNSNNGVRDAGETGIANVPITLTGRDIASATVNLATTADASGNYLFSNLLQSDAIGYTVVEGTIPPAAGALADGKDTAGSLGGSAAVKNRTDAIVLPAGNVATGYLFGELPNASISGSVYLDRNRNGTMEATPADGRIAGVTVRLLQGASCASGTLLQTTTTAAAGGFSFSGVSGGQNYLVCETQPAGYAQGSVTPGTNGTTPAIDTILVTNLAIAGSTGNLFGERAGSIAGNVFLDANNDGLRTGDAGIAGMTITLSGADAAGTPVSRTATSDATGAWRFDDVLAAGPGGYTVTEQAAQPIVAGTTTLNGKTSAGSSGGTASAVTTTPSAIATIALAAGADAIENNFAEILPVGLAGSVFFDLNNNGVQNLPGDTGIAGVALVLTGTDDNGTAVTRNVTTIADGTYSVANLRPGTYTVTEPTQPAGTTNGMTVAGSAGGTATTQAVTPSAIATIALTTPGTSATGYNFAEIPNTSSVSGRVWLDADNSGTINGAETGIAGVTIDLTGTDLGGTAITRTTTTDSSGNYSFPTLAPGTYAVHEPTQPAATLNGTTVAGSTGGTATTVATLPSVVSGIVLGVGQSSAGNNFGELPGASIAGHVIGDSNNNGRLDAGETGIANVATALTGSDDLGQAVNATATTDASGAYSFANLRPGSYTVTEPTQAPGTVNGITTAGTVNGTSTGTATPPATAPSTIAGIVLPAGAASINNDFAEIGNSPDVLVSKASVEARFTINNLGTYTIRVRNGGEVATNAPVRVSDRLPAGLTLAAVPAGTGWTCIGAIGAASFICTSSDVLGAGATSPNAITVKVNIAASALPSSPAINAVMVDGGGELPARASTPTETDAFNNTPANLPVCAAGITQNGCRTATPIQASASISGTTWYDTGATRGVLDGGDKRLVNWQVEVLDTNGTIVARATTAADGSYRINDLLPGVVLHVRFRDPAANVVWGYPVNGEASAGSSGASCNTTQAIADGTASSCPGTGADPTLMVVLASGANLPQQSLPVDPSGVVYDSGTRQPVPGSIVTLAPVGTCAGWNPATGLVAETLGGFTVNGDAVSMTVGTDGFYQFLFSPAAPASCTFSLAVAPPTGYRFVSLLIPPTAGPFAPPGGPGATAPVQPQAGAPTGPVGPATTYYLTVTGGSTTANIINNHLPLDPDAPTGLSLSKTGDKTLAEVGDSVRYTITVQRSSGPVPRQVTVVDRLPAGFTFIAGTAVVNGVSVADPFGKPGPALTFNLGPMPSSGQLVLQYRIRVGVGAQQGDGINRAIGYGCGVPAGCTTGNGTTPLAGSAATNEGRFQVRVSGGVFTTEACVLGKIFVDCNGNHVQDEEEIGIPGVRLVISDGTTLISDSEGKYSYCGLPPRSHVMRVDETTLPRGSRLTTSSNRNLGDAGSLWLDLKNGELARADFIEGSCSPSVLDQVKARRAQGEIRSVETEKKSLPALKFDSKDKGPRPRTAPPAEDKTGGTP